MVKLALSALCEHPVRRTGLSTFFPGLVGAARRAFPEVRWVVFVGPESGWDLDDGGVEVVREFAANDRRGPRLWADHFGVAPAARQRGASALLTVGFVPLRTAGLPVAMQVLSLHHQRAAAGWGAWYRRAAVGLGLRRATWVMTNTGWTADQLGGRRGAVLVSPEGVDHTRFVSAGPKGGDTLPAEYLLWTGNFYPYKRAELALATYARLPAGVRARFPFLLAGGDWEGGRARAEAAARTLGIAAEVRFLGWVDDQVLPALYRGARALIMPTREETFGRSVTEAMACGCVCLLQDLPVLREVAGEAARFCDFADGAAAAAALEQVCTDDLLVARLRSAGLRRVTGYSFDRMARERVGAILATLSAR